MLFRDPAHNKKKKDAQASLAWAEEVLITKADVKKTRATITELETKVRELKLANDYEIKVKEKEYARQLSELHDKYQMVRNRCLSAVDLSSACASEHNACCDWLFDFFSPSPIKLDCNANIL